MSNPTPKPDAPPPAEVAADPLEGLVPGRVVHYEPHAHESRNAAPGPWPALVTKVGERGLVTLNVHKPAPTMIGDDPVSRVTEVPYSAERVPGSWSWIFPGQATRYKPDRTV